MDRIGGYLLDGCSLIAFGESGPHDENRITVYHLANKTTKRYSYSNKGIDDARIHQVGVLQRSDEKRYIISIMSTQYINQYYEKAFVVLCVDLVANSSIMQMLFDTIAVHNMAPPLVGCTFSAVQVDNESIRICKPGISEQVYVSAEDLNNDGLEDIAIFKRTFHSGKSASHDSSSTGSEDHKSSVTSEIIGYYAAIPKGFSGFREYPLNSNARDFWAIYLKANSLTWP